MPTTTYTFDAATIEDRVRGAVDVEDDADLTEPMAAGLVIVEERLSPAGYGQSTMATIHVWLSAHFYEVNRQRMFEEQIGRASEKPETKVGLGLDLTRPGQQIRALDTKGALADLYNPIALRPARMYWAGTPREAF